MTCADLWCRSVDFEKTRTTYIERTKMRIARLILGLTLEDRKMSDDTRRVIGVACVTDKVREAWLRCYRHVQRREDDYSLVKFMDNERSRVRQRKRWIDTVRHTLEELRLMTEDAKDRNEWRRRILWLMRLPGLGDTQPEGERNVQKLIKTEVKSLPYLSNC